MAETWEEEEEVGIREVVGIRVVEVEVAGVGAAVVAVATIVMWSPRINVVGGEVVGVGIVDSLSQCMVLAAGEGEDIETDQFDQYLGVALESHEVVYEGHGLVGVE